MADASLIEVKNFFGYDNPHDFKKDWTALDEEERKYFKSAVGEVIHPE